MALHEKREGGHCAKESEASNGVEVVFSAFEIQRAGGKLPRNNKTSSSVTLLNSFVLTKRTASAASDVTALTSSSSSSISPSKRPLYQSLRSKNILVGASVMIEPETGGLALAMLWSHPKYGAKDSSVANNSIDKAFSPCWSWKLYRFASEGASLTFKNSKFVALGEFRIDIVNENSAHAAVASLRGALSRRPLIQLQGDGPHDRHINCHKSKSSSLARAAVFVGSNLLCVITENKESKENPGSLEIFGFDTQFGSKSWHYLSDRTKEYGEVNKHTRLC